MSFKLKRLRGIDWLELSNIHLNSATILYENNGNNGVVCYHIQQAMEKCLKGYILLETGELVDGHSLICLVNIASQCNPSFQVFINDAPFIGTFYIEENYPGEDPLAIKKADLEYAFSIYYKMHDIVENILEDIYVH